jgi:Flp pilus assembly protein TadD
MRRSFCSAAMVMAATLAVMPAYADEVDDATALLRAGKTGEAMVRVDTYLGKNPKDARGRFLRGTILAEQSQADAAIVVFRALTEEMPELPEPHNNLGVLYAAKGRYEDARRVLETAVLTHPGYALAHENLGDIYARIAAQSYERAGKLDPKSSTANTKLKLIDQLLEK